ncbi:hypothetical protein VC83_03929 [Pseudogymnoascus destructans]|uniref:C2H2-type domain-containing protein n=1 Tax=Pseudogymnoascus destructans TaxID=655981 RepID=A0A177AC82_9PEZI|nr:uncharacterized protein VC83_03929 [Pseudogymnoascus destructans]OAF59719.1 hypothetical protein VC83_03929 [Pseudogymnoascus destructans]
MNHFQEQPQRRVFEPCPVPPPTILITPTDNVNPATTVNTLRAMHLVTPQTSEIYTSQSQGLPQLGNPNAHQLCYSGKRTYPHDPVRCKLDQCSQQFNTVIDLKSHQNECHRDTLHTLMVKFENKDYIPEDDEMFAYLVLAGIRFIWSRKLDHPRISARNILISPKGEVKIDHTDFPSSDGQTSENMGCLKTLMLCMMHEQSAVPVQPWSAEAGHFMTATSWASPYELSDHVFIARCSSTATVLNPLCMLSHFLVNENVTLCQGFDGRKIEPTSRDAWERSTS